jgi:hypothetical protein
VSVTPSVAWGLGLGLLIATIDTISVFLIGSMDSTNVTIAELDRIANVVLYALIGFQVGKRTGVVRDAAEGGVIAGVLVAAIGVGVSYLLPVPDGGIRTAADVVAVLAINVAIGGVLSIITGWVGARSQQDASTTRR